MTSHLRITIDNEMDQQQLHQKFLRNLDSHHSLSLHPNHICALIQHNSIRKPLFNHNFNEIFRFKNPTITTKGLGFSPSPITQLKSREEVGLSDCWKGLSSVTRCPTVNAGSGRWDGEQWRQLESQRQGSNLRKKGSRVRVNGDLIVLGGGA